MTESTCGPKGRTSAQLPQVDYAIEGPFVSPLAQGGVRHPTLVRTDARGDFGDTKKKKPAIGLITG